MSRHRPLSVVFDLDGVLVDQDSTVTFLLERLRRAPARTSPALPVAIAHQLSARPRWRHFTSRLIIRSALLGERLSTVDQELTELALRFAARADPVRKRARTALLDHLDAGDDVLVDTASPSLFTQPFLAAIGAGAALWTGSTLEERRGGVAMTDHNYHSRKLGTANSQGFQPPFDVVYTDSASDLPLLAASRKAVLVDPSDHTLKRLPGDILARCDIWR